MAGLFVTFEGIDRSGKTTQARMLCEALGDEALAVREPGGTAVGERVRDLLKDPAVEMAPEAEALLFAAARAELVAKVIRPALAEGRVVVSDRFLDSSLAYQGHARGLGVDEVERINRWATGGLLPDLTILLSIEPSAAAERAGHARSLRGRGPLAAGGRVRRPTRSSRPRIPRAGAASTPTGLRPRSTPTCWRRCRQPGWWWRDDADAAPAPRTTRTRGWCWARRWSRAARRTPTCSTGRRARASARPRGRSPPSCSPRAIPTPTTCACACCTAPIPTSPGCGPRART